MNHQPKTLAEAVAAHVGNPRNLQLATKHNPKPWVIVTNAGCDDEDIFSDHATYREALVNTMQCNEHWDIMVRQDDGTLTTEF